MSSDDEFIRVDRIVPDSRYNVHIISRCGENFNPMQSAVAKQLIDSDDSMVVAAPTGSGKTLLHELAILRYIIRQEQTSTHKKSKVLFIAPTKALCQQRTRDWKTFQGRFGLKVVELTGDSSPNDALKEITSASIIITTPEKWDSITRIWRQHLFLLGTVSLLLLDEIHCIGESRGACLEAVVARTRMITQLYIERTAQSAHDPQNTVETTNVLPKPLRIIALSATLPNVGDVGEWLGCPLRGVHYFDDTYRPVPLEIRCVSCGHIGNNEYLFDKKLDERVPEIVKTYSDKRQTIIFCHAVAQTVTLASLLLERLGPQSQDTCLVATESLRLCQEISDTKLRLYCKQGIAYHNAMASAEDRAAVEKLFISGFLQILCSTSTLAHGMNLPAYCVIIRGTRAWRGSEGFTDVGRSDIIQMMGRAGRPGFDSKGLAVVLTDSASCETYTSANSDSLGADVAESHLLPTLTETICAEVAQGVIADINGAFQWIQRTFFYVRVRRNPKHYGFSSSSELSEQLRNVCLHALERLAHEGLLKLDPDSGQVTCCPEAIVMSSHMVQFNTMVLLLALPAGARLQPLLRQLCTSGELQHPLRRHEKKELNDRAKNIRFPLSSRERVKTPLERSYILLQLAAEGIEPDCASLRIDVPLLVDVACRILTALIGLALERKRGGLLESAFVLRRSLKLSAWSEGATSVFLQIPGLSPTLRLRLQNRACSVSKLGLADALNKLSGSLMHDFQCSQQDAERIYEFVQLCARTALRVAVKVEEAATKGQAQVLHVDIMPVYPAWPMPDKVVGKAFRNPSSQLICFDTNSGRLLRYQHIDAGTSETTVIVPLPVDVAPGDVRCSLISDFVGLDSLVSPQDAQPLQTKASPVTPTQASQLNTKKGKLKVVSKAAASGTLGRVSPFKGADPIAEPSYVRNVSPSAKGPDVEKPDKSFSMFAYQDTKLPIASSFVPPTANAPLPAQTPLSNAFAAAFYESPVYQNYTSSAPITRDASQLVKSQHLPMRGPDLLNLKRHQLQLLGTNCVKRLRPEAGPARRPDTYNTVEDEYIPGFFTASETPVEEKQLTCPYEQDLQPNQQQPRGQKVMRLPAFSTVVTPAPITITAFDEQFF